MTNLNSLFSPDGDPAFVPEDAVVDPTSAPELDKPADVIQLKPPKEESTETAVVEKEFVYEVLTTNKGPVDDEKLKTRYLTWVDQLIYRMEGLDHPESGTPDYVIFLDKSARPLAWLVKEFWPHLAQKVPADPNNPKSELVTPKMPEIKFLNIDREAWQEIVGRSDTGVIDVSGVSKTDIEDLRGIFLKNSRDDNNSTFEQEALFDGKSILVIDEVKTTGDTLETARKMLGRAFPTAIIRDAWWMIPSVVDTGKGGKRVGELPVWYSSDTPAGRGVGNRVSRLSSRSYSSRQRYGALFLSTRHTEPDALSDQLRLEVHQLAKDYLGGKLRFIPHYGREVRNKQK